MNEENALYSIENPAPAELTAQKHIYTLREKILLLVSVSLAILFDRLSAANIDSELFLRLTAAFWIIFILSFSAFNFDRIKTKLFSLFFGMLSLVLCSWYYVIPASYSNIEYSMLTLLVMPCVTVAFTQYVRCGFNLKDAAPMFVSIFQGFFYMPFVAIPKYFGAIHSLFKSDNRAQIKKTLMGLLISIPLLAVLFCLMMSADRVFQFYAYELGVSLNLSSIVSHFILIVCLSVFLYSYLWTARYKTAKTQIQTDKISMNLTVSAVVLGSTLCAYALFCTVQFTFLFGRAGLPADLTYSQYAVSGFWQLIVIAFINLALFGTFSQFTREAKWFKVMLAALIAATGVVLASAAVRLGMYIEAYGFTWLRLLSGWFLSYLAFVLASCIIRLFTNKLPLAAICATALVIWYIVLGYLNSLLA